jgi:O-antigen/teichoic acid export membrane protein
VARAVSEEASQAGKTRGVVEEPDVDVLATADAGPTAVRGGALRVISYVVGALISALGAAVLFRQLGLVDTGHYVTAVTVVGIVGGVSDLGLNAVGLRESAILDQAKRSELFADLLGLRIVLTSVGLMIALALSSLGYSSTIVIGILLAGIGLLLQTIADNLSLQLLVTLRLGSIAFLEVLRQALTVLGMLLLVLAAGHLLAFLSLSIPVGVVLLVVTAWLVRRQRSLRPRFSWQRWRPMLTRILPYSAAAAASVLYYRVAVLMVSLLSSNHQQALFNVSYRIIDALTLAPSLLAGAALPIFSRAASEDHERLVYGLGKVFEVGLIVGAGVILMLGIGAPFILRVLGGPQYVPAAGVLTIQAVGLGATFVGIVWANGLLSLALYRHILALNAAGLIGMTILLAVVVPDHGARGAAVATALGEISAAVAGGAVLIRRHPSLARSLRVTPRVALAAAVAAASLAIPDLTSLEQMTIAGVLYLLALLVLRAFPPELGALMPQRLGRSLGLVR